MGDSPAQISNNVPCKAACIARWGGGGGWIGGGMLLLHVFPFSPRPLQCRLLSRVQCVPQCIIRHQAKDTRQSHNAKIQCNKGVVKPEKPHKVVKKEARIKSRGELGHIKAVLKGMCVYVRFESDLHVQWKEFLHVVAKVVCWSWLRRNVECGICTFSFTNKIRIWWIFQRTKLEHKVIKWLGAGAYLFLLFLSFKHIKLPGTCRFSIPQDLVVCIFFLHPKEVIHLRTWHKGDQRFCYKRQ